MATADNPAIIINITVPVVMPVVANHQQNKKKLLEAWGGGVVNEVRNMHDRENHISGGTYS